MWAHCRKLDHARGFQKDLVRRYFLDFVLNNDAAKTVLAANQALAKLVSEVTADSMTKQAAGHKYQAAVARNSAAVTALIAEWAKDHTKVRAPGTGIRLLCCAAFQLDVHLSKFCFHHCKRGAPY